MEDGLALHAKTVGFKDNEGAGEPLFGRGTKQIFESTDDLSWLRGPNAEDDNARVVFRRIGEDIREPFIVCDENPPFSTRQCGDFQIAHATYGTMSIMSRLSERLLDFGADVFVEQEPHLGAGTGRDVLVGPHRLCGKLNGRLDVSLGKLGIRFESVLGRLPGRQHFQNKIDHDPGSLETRLPVADLGVNGNVVFNIGASHPSHRIESESPRQTDPDTRWWVTSEKTGFTVHTSDPAALDLEFTWIAIE